MYGKVNAAAFESFDPDNFNSEILNHYDPDNLGGKPSATRTASAGQKLQVNLTLANPTASLIKVELFSALDSFIQRLKTELVTGNYKMIPALSIEGQAAAGVGVVGFDQNGNLSIRGNAGDPIATVGCGEVAYKTLFDTTRQSPFKVAYMRMTCNTDAQIDNNITHFAKTLGGGIRQNTISPRAYFKPNQFQSRIIDITSSFVIDGEKGLSIPVNAGENVRLSMFIQEWTRPNMQ